MNLGRKKSALHTLAQYGVTILFLSASLLISSDIFAADGTTDDLIKRLLVRIEVLSERIGELESHAKSPAPEPQLARIKPGGTQNNWVERIKLKGDLRSRFENIDDSEKASERNRHRVRARLEVLASLNDSWSAGFGLASGNDDPRSTNQSLGAGATTKNMGLDLAYVSYRPSSSVVLMSGKVKNPFHRAGGYPLIWDSDYRPEGFALKYRNGSLWSNAMIHFLESDNRSGNKDVETSYGLQVGMSRALDTGVDVVLGASYFQFAVQGSSPFYKNNPVGNSIAVDGTYLFDYKELELFAEASSSLGDLPVSLFLDYISNLDVSKNDTGWAAGVALGKADAPGRWQVAYRYQVLEADALYGARTDSDFGSGVTDNRGHVIQASMAFHKNIKLALKYMITEYGKENQGFFTDYDRFQFDLQLKF